MTITWSQNYDPLHAWPLSTLVAALPVLTLFVVLLAFRARVWVAALAGLMRRGRRWRSRSSGCRPAGRRRPADWASVFGLFRIAWIIVASIFLYDIAVETGQFQVMKESIAALSSDKRLQLILIAFCFGAFLEGTGGGGAPVAIAGLVPDRAGFRAVPGGDPLPGRQHRARGLGRRSAPRSASLAEVTGLPEPALGAMAGRILPPLSAILPFWLVRSMVGWRETVRRLAGPGGQRRLVRARPVLLVELPGVGPGRRRARPGLARWPWSLFLKVWRPRSVLARRTGRSGRRRVDRPRHGFAVF